MKKLYNHLILLSCCFLGVSATAQLHVAKDNIACAYGLKNEAGKWIVQPGYTYIDDVPGGCFKAVVGEQSGVFSSEGQVIVPFVYDIYPINVLQDKVLFIATESPGVNYVYTSEGKKLFDKAYRNIRTDENYLILITTRGDSIFSSCADFSGRMIFENVHGDAQVIRNSPFFKVIEYRSDVESHVGVIDSAGKQVIPPLYHEIEYIGGNFLVTTDDLKHGVINKQNQFLLRPDYYIHFPNNRSASGIVPGKLYIIETENKQGLLQDFQVVLAPEYTAIYPVFSGHPDGKMFIWSDRKMGVYSEGTVIPAVYDELAAVGIPRQLEGFFYACRIGQKWGLLNAKGKLVLDVVYDNFDIENRPNMQYGMDPGICLFGKGKDMYAVDLRQEKFRTEKMTNWSEGVDYKILSYKDKLYPFQLNYAKDWYYLHLGINFRVQLILKERIYIGFGDVTRIFDLNGKRLDQDNVEMLHGQILRCKNGKFGLIHKVTGKMLIDTIYSEILPMNYQNLILARHSQKQEWTAFDTLGNLRTKTIFDTLPDLYNGIARERGLYGLIDLNLNWIVQPAYRNMVLIFGKRFFEKQERLYYAEMPSGTLVILDETGKSIVPGGYKELIPVFSSSYYDDESQELRSDLYPFWWILKNGNHRLFFNNLKQFRAIEPDDFAANRFADSLMFNATFVNEDDARYPEYSTPEIQGKINACNECFTIRYYDTEGSFENVPYKREIYELFRKLYVSGLPCFEYPSLKVEGNCNNLYYESYKINFFGRKFLTTNTYRNYFLEKDERTIITWKSYIWKENRLQEVGLTDIFGTGTVLREELVYAIQSGDYELDCSTPDKMIEQIGHNFMLTADGILLQLNSRDELLVSIDRLKARKETRWFAKYLE